MSKNSSQEKKKAVIGDIALILMAMKDQMKIYHWRTNKYSRHIASDALVAQLSENTDKFIEIIQGKYGVRLDVTDKSIIVDNYDDNEILAVMKEFVKFLSVDLPKFISKKDTDLLTIRDDMLADMNKGLYLFSLE